MGWFSNYWENSKTRRKANKEKYIKERANDIYQITEYCGRLWFTYNGSLFCPCDMMKKEPLDALLDLRTSYIVRNSNN
jgi:hypothetical protein